MEEGLFLLTSHLPPVLPLKLLFVFTFRFCFWIKLFIVSDRLGFSKGLIKKENRKSHLQKTETLWQDLWSGFRANPFPLLETFQKRGGLFFLNISAIWWERGKNGKRTELYLDYGPPRQYNTDTSFPVLLGSPRWLGRGSSRRTEVLETGYSFSYEKNSLINLKNNDDNNHPLNLNINYMER